MVDFATVVFATMSFAKEKEAELPKWVMNKIALETPTKISKMMFKNRLYYLIDAPCCDQYNYIYSESGRKLCAKDGGQTGRGDGKCPQIFTKQALEQTWQAVWQQGEKPKE